MPRIVLLICIVLANYTHEGLVEIFLQDNERNNTDLIPIIQHYFRSKSCVSFVKLVQDPAILNTYFQCINLPRIVIHVDINEIRPMQNNTIRLRRDFYTKSGTLNVSCQYEEEGVFIFAPSLQLVHAYMLTRMLTPFLNPQATFFIYIAEEIFQNRALEVFFEELWQIYRTPFVTMSCYKCNQVYLYNFKSRNNNTWGQLFSYNLMEVLNKPNLLKNNLDDLEGYPFKSTMFHSIMANKVSVNNSGIDYYGVDSNLLSLLAKQMNFTKIIMEPRDNDTFGERMPDNSFSGSLGTILSGESYMVCVGYFLKDYETRDAEFSASAMQDDLCVVTHKAKRIPQWMVLYYYFDSTIWLTLVFIYISLVLTWKLIQRLDSHILANTQVPNTTFLDTFRMMIGVPIIRSPTMTSERIFMSACLMAFSTLVGTFQGSFVIMYSTKFFYPDVNTLEQLAQINMPIVTRFEGIKQDVFSDDSNPTVIKLKNMLMVYKQKQEINLGIVRYANMSGLIRKSSMDLENKTNFYDSQGSNLLYIIKECARTYNLAYMFPTASAFAPGINRIILRTSAAGLFVKWYKEMAANKTLSSQHSSYNRIKTDPDEKRPLTMQDTQLAFYELLIGFGISILGFICELILHKFKTH
ncbi:Ionotropic receptor 100a [Carabus blaptoides fortunei]